MAYYNILLVEDILVNQRLAVRILEKAGHKVTVAENGKVGVEHYEKTPFDLILMDIQMPVMSGYEATKAIREKEKESGAHIPIIAVTAHAMKGDEEKCLAAGMDGYVTKPINKQALFTEMSRQMEGRPTVEAADSSVNSNMDAIEKIIDREAVMQVVSGDMELLREMVEIFLDDCPKLLTNIRDAIATQNSEVLEREAHSLKDAVQIFSADKAIETAYNLGEIGKNAEFPKAEEAYKELEREIKRLEPELIALRAI